jgi:hypothetical protein
MASRAMANAIYFSWVPRPYNAGPMLPESQATLTRTLECAYHRLVAEGGFNPPPNR